MEAKERVNEIRNKLMQEAVEAIAQMEPKEYDAQIERCQQAMLVMLAAKKRAQQQRAAAANNGAADQYELRCGSCDKVLSHCLCNIYSYYKQQKLQGSSRSHCSLSLASRKFA